MRKRRKNERQKCCSAALALLILCSWMVSSIIVYGFDMSGMDSFDTGGFDMNVGEGEPDSCRKTGKEVMEEQKMITVTGILKKREKIQIPGQ